jgi:hypothetical protein
MVPDTDVTQEKSPKDEVPGLDQAAEEGDMPAVSPESRHVPNWIRIGLGIVALILIAVLAGPTLVEQFQKDEQPSDTSSADLEQSLAADPDNEQLRYNLAAAYYQEGRFEAAWEQLRSVPAYVAIIDTRNRERRASSPVLTRFERGSFQVGHSLGPSRSIDSG